MMCLFIMPAVKSNLEVPSVKHLEQDAQLTAWAESSAFRFYF